MTENLPVHLRKRQPAPGRRLDRPAPPAPLPCPVYDAHAHLEFADGQEPLGFSESLDLAQSVGVVGVIQVGTDLETSRWSASLSEIDARVLAGVALHPDCVLNLANLEDELTQIAKLTIAPRVRVIGETGLDFYPGQSLESRRAQLESFEAHIQIAKAANLPLMIHDRNAHGEVVRTLKRAGAPPITVFHCFSGDVELARTCIKNGWYMSASGTLTFSSAKDIREAFRLAPSELLLLETDSPFLAPTPCRGCPNAPYLLPYTARVLAEIRSQDLRELCGATARNSELIFGPW